MRQLYKVGQAVEVFDDGWRKGEVLRVVRLSDTDGTRSYVYGVEYEAVLGEGGKASFTWHFDQDRVRIPGQVKHSSLVPPKPKKLPRPLRAHRYK